MVSAPQLLIDFDRGDRPGNEIQSPTAEVILGGLLSSTLLNLVVVPVLFLHWGGAHRSRIAPKL